MPEGAGNILVRGATNGAHLAVPDLAVTDLAAGYPHTPQPGVTNGVKDHGPTVR